MNDPVGRVCFNIQVISATKGWNHFNLFNTTFIDSYTNKVSTNPFDSNLS